MKLSPQKTLERINQVFLSEIKTDHFVTFFYAILDTNNHTRVEFSRTLSGDHA
jgi:serine phosphatase RsbU (regulator of sigma subunit)